MIIDINSIDMDQFQVKEGIFCGEESILVTPNHIGTKFTQKNKRFRSSIWNKSGELLSASLMKFVNAGERPEDFPLPSSLKNTKAMLKIDGSTLIITKRNGILNCRTRGAFDVEQQPNSYEISILQEKYPLAFDNELLDSEQYSLIFEWVSPVNVIVVKYPEPDMILLNIVKHSNYSYFTQNEIDSFAEQYGLQRPSMFYFDTIETLRDQVYQWDTNEGVVLYHSNDQECHKFKAAKYLYIHSIKSSLNTEEKLIDLFLTSKTNNYNEFFDYIATNIDYEVAQHFRGQLSKICDANKEVMNILDGMQNFVNNIQNMTRKEQALKITSAYGKTNRASFVFCLLDGKELDNKAKKKLFFQVLK